MEEKKKKTESMYIKIMYGTSSSRYMSNWSLSRELAADIDEMKRTKVPIQVYQSI